MAFSHRTTLPRTLTMLSLQIPFCALLIATIFTTLPATASCDSSYYEKYYAARRFLPPKRSELVTYNFTVDGRREEGLSRSEHVMLVGDVKQLGAWSPDRAIRLNRTVLHNVWTASVQLPVNVSVMYRYFVAVLDNVTGSLQIRRWESSLQARSLNTSAIAGNRTDIFGRVSGAAQREVQRGWLHSGRIVQFQFFRNPFKFEPYLSMPPDERIYIKLQPVEPEMLTPIFASAKANTEYARMQQGDSFIRAQPEYGVLYEPGDIVIFHTTVIDLQRVAYVLKLYRSRMGSDIISLFGYQYIFPSFLGDASTGNFSVKLISPVWLNVIGSVDVQYLVIAPLPRHAARVDFRTGFADYWRDNWTALDVGHRGLGKSLKLVTKNAPVITENTIASLQATAELGSDLCEFDVMLTSDLVPILYHDYVVYVCMDSKTPKSKEDLTAVPIKDITYEQLKNLKTYQVVGSKIIEYPAHNNVEQVEHRLFPLFQEVLTQVNKSLGFDIEIKWPQQLRNGMFESEQTIDKNVYVDRILEVMLRHGCGRLSFFTSFDADICTMLRYKQNMYPVMFLSSSKEAAYADPRSDTIYDAVNNAQAFDLVGVVPNAVFIQQDPKWIQVAQRQGKKVFLWGDKLKDAETITWFKSTGATGVIYDRVDLWLPLDKRNIFERDHDLLELFQLQCPPKAVSGVVNTTVERILSDVNVFQESGETSEF